MGRFYAVSTAGSILGVFLTGFVLIQWIGTRPIVLAVAIFLFGMALLFGGLWRARLKVLAAIAVGVAALFITLSFTHGWLETYCQKESNYFCIRVRERLIDGHRVRT